MTKKLVRFMVLCFLVFVMIVPAFAAEKELGNTSCKVTISNFVGETKETIKVYGEDKEYDVILVTEGARVTVTTTEGTSTGVSGMMPEGDGSYYDDPCPWTGGGFRPYVEADKTVYVDLKSCDYYNLFIVDKEYMIKIVDGETVSGNEESNLEQKIVSDSLVIKSSDFDITITNVTGETTESLIIDDKTREEKVYLITEGSQANLTAYKETFAGGGLIHNDSEYMYSDPSLVWNVDGEESHSPIIEAGKEAYMKFEGKDYYYFGYEYNDERVNFILKVVKESSLEEDNDVANKEVIFADNDSPNNWAKGDVALAIKSNLVPKDLQNKYLENISRKDFCKAIVQVIEAKTGKSIDEVLNTVGRRSDDNNPFTDTNEKYIIDAYQLKILSGRGNRIFDPNGSISRQEAAAMLTSAARVLGASTTGSDCGFADKDVIKSYAINSVNFVSQTKIMGSMGGNNFGPNSPYTRQQSYITLLRLYNYVNK